MLDIKWIRENPEKVKEAMKNRGVDFDVAYLLDLDTRRRRKIKETEDLRAQQNEAAEAMGRCLHPDAMKK